MVMELEDTLLIQDSALEIFSLDIAVWVESEPAEEISTENWKAKSRKSDPTCWRNSV